MEEQGIDPCAFGMQSRRSTTPNREWSYGVVVSISGCDPLDPGSTPGTASFLFFVCVAGVMVSIAAFQAVDPGSIPGPRRFFSRCRASSVR